MAMVPEMPVLAVARIVGETDTRIWRVVQHYVDEARAQEDFSAVTKVGLDETSRAKRHKYVTLFVDLDRSKVLFATEGKDAETLQAFRKDLEAHNGSGDSVEELSMDMSPAFVSGAAEHFPQASVTFDRFHVMGLMSKAVDEVRRAEVKERDELKGTRYAWLKNPKKLGKGQAEEVERLSATKLKTARAYRIRLALQEFYAQPPEEAEGHLKRWYGWAIRSRLEPVKKAARTIKAHWAGVLNYAKSQLTNGVLESINGVVQAARARARGYRSVKNFVTMIYLLRGKLDLGDRWGDVRAGVALA